MNKTQANYKADKQTLSDIQLLANKVVEVMCNKIHLEPSKEFEQELIKDLCDRLPGKTLTKGQIQAEVERLVEIERERSYEIGNGRFNSAHEGYAVIREEVEEAEEEAKQLKMQLGIMWHYTRTNEQKNCDRITRAMYDTALKAAYEAIQIAAMAKKYLESI
jgi:hypothetical protein